MSTKIRPEVSKRNKYWISRHRYYELKHFCLQYPEWKEKAKDCARYSGQGDGRVDVEWSDPTYTAMHICQRAKEDMQLVEECCRVAGGDLGGYILRAVTEGLSYVNLRMMYQIPCGRDLYYELYRRFYYILSVRK